MNFFEHQDRAHRNTRYLILLLIAAVVSLVAITTLLFATLAYFSDEHRQQAAQTVWQGILHALSPATFLWIALSVSSVVLLGSLFRFMQLGGGGKTVAEAMGGRLLMGNTLDADERKILNVVMEAYPDLKASQNMMQVSEELTSTENKVAFARQAFNDAVTAYNTYKQSFPPVVLAASFGHRDDASLLVFADSAEIQSAPKVQF